MLRPPVRDLRAKSVFLTGAASGIGRATALAAAREGAVLFLTDVDEPGLRRITDEVGAAGGEVAYAAPVDLADHGAVRAMAEEITSRHGAMDVVMNIAGIASWGTIQAMPHRTWQRVVDVNLMGPIAVLEHLVPPMIEAGRGGHVVNVSSAAGIIGMPWHAAYSASKFGLRGVSEVLRFDLAPHRIGVSLVCPGVVDTGLTETVQVAGVDNTNPQFRRLRAGVTSAPCRPSTPPRRSCAGRGAPLLGLRPPTHTSGWPTWRSGTARRRTRAMVVMNRVANRALP